MRDANDQAFAAAGVPREMTYEINDAATVVDLVRHGLATGMIMASAVDRAPGIDLVPVRRHVPYYETSGGRAGGPAPQRGDRCPVATIRRTAGADDPGAPLTS